MGWIGNKLSTLIEQGKKALSHEIVIMSNATEEKVNDASGAWEEQDLDENKAHHSSAKHRPRPDTDLMFPPVSASAHISITISLSSMLRHSPTPSVGFNPNDREDMQAWASQELHELMDQARAKAREHA
jgi:hypothetical protein